jgi:hypothetical protein
VRPTKWPFLRIRALRDFGPALRRPQFRYPNATGGSLIARQCTCLGGEFLASVGNAAIFGTV